RRSGWSATSRRWPGIRWGWCGGARQPWRGKSRNMAKKRKGCTTPFMFYALRGQHQVSTVSQLAPVVGLAPGIVEARQDLRDTALLRRDLREARVLLHHPALRVIGLAIAQREGQELPDMRLYGVVPCVEREPALLVHPQARWVTMRTRGP